MCESIYIEKNKSSRFGIHFYQNSNEWNSFLGFNGINPEKTAVICSKTLQNTTWSKYLNEIADDLILCLSEQDKDGSERVCGFLKQYKKDYTFVIFAETFIMEVFNDAIFTEATKLSYVLVPVTPFAMFDGVSIRPRIDENGEIVNKEILPRGVYVDVSILLQAKSCDFLGGIACAFRLAISNKVSMFEWMISNLYELLDCEEDTICEFLMRGYYIYKERIEKDTAKERVLPVYGIDFYQVLSSIPSDMSEADLWALSMVCQTYISWKKELLSMEEYYEIRDMFVFFGLSITETFATVDELMAVLEQSNVAFKNAGACVYIRKIGKIVVNETPSAELVKEAFKQIYFDELENN